MRRYFAGNSGFWHDGGGVGDGAGSDCGQPAAGYQPKFAGDPAGRKRKRRRSATCGWCCGGEHLQEAA